MINPNFVYLGSLIFLLGSSSYFFETLKGKVKPNRLSWFLWALNPLIAFFAMIQQGVGLSALATFTYGFVPVAILLASFLNKKSYWKISKVDMLCGVVSIIGLILWYVTKVGNIVILFAIVSDFFASIPTVIKSYKAPETENWILFFTNAISAAITLLTIKVWIIAEYAFPLYIFLICVLLVVLIKLRIGKVFAKGHK